MKLVLRLVGSASSLPFSSQKVVSAWVGTAVGGGGKDVGCSLRRCIRCVPLLAPDRGFAPSGKAALFACAMKPTSIGRSPLQAKTNRGKGAGEWFCPPQQNSPPKGSNKLVGLEDLKEDMQELATGVQVHTFELDKYAMNAVVAGNSIALRIICVTFLVKLGQRCWNLLAIQDRSKFMNEPSLANIFLEIMLALRHICKTLTFLCNFYNLEAFMVKHKKPLDWYKGICLIIFKCMLILCLITKLSNPLVSIDDSGMEKCNRKFGVHNIGIQCLAFPLALNNNENSMRHPLLMLKHLSNLSTFAWSEKIYNIFCTAEHKSVNKKKRISFIFAKLFKYVYGWLEYDVLVNLGLVASLVYLLTGRHLGMKEFYDKFLGGQGFD